MVQLSLALIPHKVENALINQRAIDGYVNATAMCKAVSKQFSDYARLKTSQEFIKELSSATGIPGAELIQTVMGGIPDAQGTWVHPDVAMRTFISECFVAHRKPHITRPLDWRPHSVRRVSAVLSSKILCDTVALRVT